MGQDWSVPACAGLAREFMSAMGRRWAHVQGVGTTAQELASTTPRVPELVVAAAWLHDIGYSPRVRSSGFHPIDGAEFLAVRDAPSELVSLVAYHSGAEFEAEERGLSDALASYDRPNQMNLDLLTFFDMAVSPAGERILVQDRIDGILQRYEPDHPVHRAVVCSRDSLIASCVCAARKLDLLADEWVFASV
ncbi:HD domain-containing protein [Phytoactinopolyspora mesophila]|uniref:HD domain-containing protein n=1 Tax=Phytoactinopolyspora mesophila TaxID=2650750 RepID=A0A7K3MA44_9ACTN|nr:HD domain-containing protein [Phytoactinopolyspora mesophila]